MANLDQIADYMADYVTDDTVHYADTQINTGTTQFSNWYYGEKNVVDVIGAGNKFLGMSVIDASSNRVSVLQLVGGYVIRAYSNYASIGVKVRVLYKIGENQ